MQTESVNSKGWPTSWLKRCLDLPDRDSAVEQFTELLCSNASPWEKSKELVFELSPAEAFHHLDVSASPSVALLEWLVDLPSRSQAVPIELDVAQLNVPSH